MLEVLYPACPVPDYSHLLAFEAPPPATEHERRLTPSEYLKNAKAEQISMDLLRYYEMNCTTFMKDYKSSITKQITQNSPIINDLAKIVTDFVPDMFRVVFEVHWNVCEWCHNFLVCGGDGFGISDHWSQKFRRAHPFACKCLAVTPSHRNPFRRSGRLDIKLPMVYYDSNKACIVDASYKWFGSDSE
ncbi:unnamed protein product [Sphagnum balticum]